MAKAPSKYPVTLVRGEEEREVHQVASFNQAVWDGFEYKEGEAPAGEDAPLSPQQRAAITRRENAEKRASETPAEKPSATESSVGTSAASGGTAAGETTVGSNPS